MVIRNLAIVGLHIVLSAVLAAVTAALVYGVLYDALGAARAHTLQSYIRMRAEREQAVFDRAEAYILAAEAAFERRLALLEAADADAQFDDFFPAHGDGTRRSAPALFDGLELPGGDHVYGVGAFLGDGEAMTTHMPKPAEAMPMSTAERRRTSVAGSRRRAYGASSPPRMSPKG